MSSVNDSEVVSSKPEVENVESDVQKDVEMTEEKWINLTEDGGVLKCILEEGWGEPPVPNSTVFCHYVGTLQDGTKFDSSRDRDSPFNFPIGGGKVIKGWDIGIATMKKGEKCILRCRSDYAYGEHGQGTIPPNATLDFEVELLNWSDWERVKSSDDLERKRIVKGDGDEWKTPEEEAQVTVNYIGFLKDTEAEEDRQVFAEGKGVQFILHEDDSFPKGFHNAVGDMVRGEKSKFKVQPSLAYGDAGNSDLNIPPNTPIYYVIEVVEFANPKSNWELSVEEHFEYGEKYKTQGNNFFQQGNFEQALKKYKKALDVIENDNDFGEEDKKKAKDLKVKVNGNISLIHFKRMHYMEALEKVNAVLSDDPTNLKALTRRGQIQMNMGNYEEAKSDYTYALQIDPNNQALKKLMKTNKDKIAAYRKKQKELATKMFGGKK